MILGFEPGSLRIKRKGTLDSNDTNEINEEQGQMRSLTRHLSQAKPMYDHSETGFLWSWNFMISKKWKITSNTGATGEIAFMDKMLEDFRAFCRNDNGRLVHFWQECMAKYQKQVNEENPIQEDATKVAVEETNVINLSED